MKGHASIALESCFCEVAEIDIVRENTKPRFSTVVSGQKPILSTYTYFKKTVLSTKKPPSTHEGIHPFVLVGLYIVPTSSLTFFIAFWV